MADVDYFLKLDPIKGESTGKGHVNEIEVLTTNLSRKIWQKIAIIAEGSSRKEKAPAGL